MSETNHNPATTDRQPPANGSTVPIDSGPFDSGVPLGSLLGADHRLDPPHAGGAENSAGREEIAPRAAQSAGGRVSREQRELLLQASQIAEQLQDQFRELDRRESALNEQLAALDQERRGLRLRVQEFEDRMLDREEEIRARQADFTNKFATCEKLVAELEQQQAELDRARADLDARRSSLREDLGRELEIERAALHERQAGIEAEHQQKQREIEEYRRQCDSWLESERAELAGERHDLQQTVEAEFQQEREALDREREEFEAERSDWTVQCERQLAELKREQEAGAAALAATQEQLQQARRAHEELAARQTGELQTRLDKVREEFDAELAGQRAEWDIRRESERAEIQRERERAEQATAQSEAELEQQRVQLVAEREQFQQEEDDRRRKFQQEQSVQAGRLRFQQEHLDKTRQELESLQHERQVEQQRAQVECQRQSELLRLRGNQLDHYRALLDEREQSSHREQRLLAQWRHTADADVRREKARLRQEQEVWEQERRAQQAEVRRQQDMLAMHAENLESRRDRLDQLRTELEETHRRTLEMRMSIEEAWAGLAQTTGEESARHRVDEASAALETHYGRLGETITAQRQELLEARQKFQKQREDLRGEKRQLTTWIAEREEAFRTWERQLRQEADNINTGYERMQAARDSWMRDKVAAEGVIRSLLAQLSESDEGESDAADVVAVDPVNEGGADVPSAVP